MAAAAATAFRVHHSNANGCACCYLCLGYASHAVCRRTSISIVFCAYFPYIHVICCRCLLHYEASIVYSFVAASSTMFCWDSLIHHSHSSIAYWPAIHSCHNLLQLKAGIMADFHKIRFRAILHLDVPAGICDRYFHSTRHALLHLRILFHAVHTANYMHLAYLFLLVWKCVTTHNCKIQEERPADTHWRSLQVFILFTWSIYSL